MRNKFLHLLAVAALPACTEMTIRDHDDDPATRTKTIRYDEGGWIGQPIVDVAVFNENGWSIRYEGVAISAGTLYLGVAKVCTTPDSLFGFHGPVTDLGLPAPPGEERDRAVELMARHYPPGLRERFLAGWQYRWLPAFVTGLEVHRLTEGRVPICAD